MKSHSVPPKVHCNKYIINTFRCICILDLEVVIVRTAAQKVLTINVALSLRGDSSGL